MPARGHDHAQVHPVELDRRRLDGHAIGIGPVRIRILCTELALAKANRGTRRRAWTFERSVRGRGQDEEDRQRPVLEQTRKELYGDASSLSELSDLCLAPTAFSSRDRQHRAAHRNGVRFIA